jgi:tetratricopeptide (TPR) repeat protein
VSFGGYYYYDRYYSSQPGVVEQTLTEAEQAVRDDPQNTEKRLSLAEKYMAALRYEDALAQANQVYSSDPENQVAWLVIGVSNANTGKPAEAIEPLTKLYEARKDEEMPGLDRQLQTAVYYLGDSYLQLGQPEKAVEPLEMGTGWSGTDADVMYKLGMAYSGIKDDKAAVLQRATAFVLAWDSTDVVTVYGAATSQTWRPSRMVALSRSYDSALDLLLQAVRHSRSHRLAAWA